MFASYSYMTGDHDFPDLIVASTFYRIANPFSRAVRGNLPVFTSTRTGNLPVTIHGNAVSFGLF